MALQFSTTVRNARLDAIETTTGATALLYLRSGTVPADCATADAGTLLCTITLPSDWMAVAASGAKAKSGTWSGTVATGGTAAHFRIKDPTGTTTHIQGTVTLTAGGGDMILDNTTLVATQTVTVNTFQLTDANA